MSLTQIGTFLIHVTDCTEKYEIRIIDSRCGSCEGFYGELLISALVNGAISLELPENQYISDAIRAITTPDGLPDFYYSFEDDVLKIYVYGYKQNSLDCPMINKSFNEPLSPVINNAATVQQPKQSNENIVISVIDHSTNDSMESLHEPEILKSPIRSDDHSSIHSMESLHEPEILKSPIRSDETKRISNNAKKPKQLAAKKSRKDKSRNKSLCSTIDSSFNTALVQQCKSPLTDCQINDSMESLHEPETLTSPIRRDDHSSIHSMESLHEPETLTSPIRRDDHSSIHSIESLHQQETLPSPIPYHDSLQSAVTKNTSADDAMPSSMQCEQFDLQSVVPLDTFMEVLNAKQCAVLDTTADPKRYLNSLLVSLFSKEVLRISSVKGEKAHRKKKENGSEKPALDPLKLNLIYNLMKEKTENSPLFNQVAINKLVAKKINNLQRNRTNNSAKGGNKKKSRKDQETISSSKERKNTDNKADNESSNQSNESFSNYSESMDEYNLSDNESE